MIERFARSIEGELVPWVEGMPVAEMRTRAGVTKVERWNFSLT
jgi:hypothetical protein